MTHTPVVNRNVPWIDVPPHTVPNVPQHRVSIEAAPLELFGWRGIRLSYEDAKERAIVSLSIENEGF